MSGLAEAVRGVRSALHGAMVMLEQRVVDGTATEDERMVVVEFQRAWELMRVERIGYDNALDEHDGIAEALSDMS